MSLPSNCPPKTIGWRSSLLALILGTVTAITASAATISPTRFHGLMVRDDGTLAAWGFNAGGQLGDGSYIDRSFPVTVAGLNGVKGAAGGVFHSVAVKIDGTVWAWGNNSFGQLGDGTTLGRVQPVKIASLTGFRRLRPGMITRWRSRPTAPFGLGD